MPTGYTYKVLEGISFNEFVWICSRAMSPLVTMRDDGADAKIPDQFEPSDFHVVALGKAMAERDWYGDLTDDEKNYLFAVRLNKERTAHDQMVEGFIKEDELFNGMLRLATEWIPPTSEHQPLKEFMIDQLAMSSNGNASEFHSQSPEDVRKAYEKRLGENIDYHEKGWKEELERTEFRNKWLVSLRESVPAP